MSVWIYQDDKQVKKHGEKAASWYVGWIDPEGKRRCKSCGPGEQGHRNAVKLQKKREAELLEGTYKSTAKMTWAEFREEWEARIASGMGAGNRRITLHALAHFERIINPKRIGTIKTATIDEFKAKRRLEPGKKKGETLSPASVNKELRHIRAVLRIANEWKCLPEIPRVRMLKEPGKLVTFVSGEHFAAIYTACDSARMPADIPGIDPADWWRGLIVFAYMTGWRIMEILSLRREDVDLDAGFAITRAEDNKGKRDERVKLHSVVVEHLQRLRGFDPFFFPWNHGEKTLYAEFHRIQGAAGIDLVCGKTHKHTDACHRYGFHDLRRAFATQNAPRLTADSLQKLMRHKSYLTTQKYINMASQLDEAVATLHVPDVLKVASGAAAD